MAERNEEKTLRDVLRVVFSHFGIFIVGASLFMIAVMVASHYIPVKYSSTAKFERRSDSAVDSLSSSPSESFQTMRLTLQQELAGPKAIEKAIGELSCIKKLPRGADGNWSPEAMAIRQSLLRELSKNITVAWEVRTDQVDVIAVTCSSTDPAVAQEIPNILIRQYLTYAGGKILERLQASRDFLQKQVDQCRSRLSQMSAAKIEFETKYGDMILSDATNLKERTQEINADIESLRRQYMIAQQKVKQVKTLMKTTRLRSIREQLQQMRNEVDTCLTLNQMTEEHPKVQALLNRISLFEERMKAVQANAQVAVDADKDGVENGMVLQLSTAESEAQMIQDQIELLERRLATYKKVMSRSVPLREEYLKIVKPLEEQEAETKRWQQRLTDTNMTIAAELGKRRTQLSAIQTAGKPAKPMFPSLWMIVCVAVGGGLIFGYGLAFTLGSMDHTLRRPEDAEKHFGVPVVGVISTIESSRQRTLRRIRQSVLTLVAALLVLITLGLSTYSALLRVDNPNGFKNLKASIHHATDHQQESTVSHNM